MKLSKNKQHLLISMQQGEIENPAISYDKGEIEANSCCSKKGGVINWMDLPCKVCLYMLSAIRKVKECVPEKNRGKTIQMKLMGSMVLFAYIFEKKSIQKCRVQNLCRNNR